MKWLQRGMGNDEWNQLFNLGKITDREFLERLVSEPPSGQDTVTNPGWYIIMLTDENDHKFWALYVGQADNLYHRKKDHSKFALLKSEGGMLYYVWRGNGPVLENHKLPRTARFIVLGTDVSGLQGKDSELFRNIGEMFYAMMAQTLQEALTY